MWPSEGGLERATETRAKEPQTETIKEEGRG